MEAKGPKKRPKQPATGQQSTKKAKREAAQAGLEQQINARAREHVRLRARVVGLGALAGGWQAAAHPGPWSLGPLPGMLVGGRPFSSALAPQAL